MIAETTPAPECVSPARMAASHARHYAALLAQEEPGTPGWQFVFGQLSAAATLANTLRTGQED